MAEDKNVMNEEVEVTEEILEEETINTSEAEDLEANAQETESAAETEEAQEETKGFFGKKKK